MIVYGIKLTNPPSLNAPKRISRIPAIKVAVARPESPYFCTILKTITANAPVGPPICTLLPPSAEIMKPATIAVKSPRSGLTPEAIAKAIGSYVFLKTYEKIGNQKEFYGDLVSFDGKVLGLDYLSKNIKKHLDIEKEKISKIRLAIKF